MSKSKRTSEAARVLGKKGGAAASIRLRAYWSSLSPEDRRTLARRGYERGIAAAKARRDLAVVDVDENPDAEVPGA